MATRVTHHIGYWESGHIPQTLLSTLKGFKSPWYIHQNQCGKLNFWIFCLKSGLFHSAHKLLALSLESISFLHHILPCKLVQARLLPMINCTYSFSFSARPTNCTSRRWWRSVNYSPSRCHIADHFAYTKKNTELWGTLLPVTNFQWTKSI